MFSRIFSNFSSRLFAQKERGFIPSPLLKPRKRIKCRVFAVAYACNPLGLFAQPQSISFGGRASLFPCLGKNAKNALLHFFNAFLTPRQGREVVCADALHILFDFCCAKMAQFCNCARLVLTHALSFIFGKASHKFFEVADSVIVLDSVNTFKSKLVLVCKLCIL